jgi:hypothetical protein
MTGLGDRVAPPMPGDDVQPPVDRRNGKRRQKKGSDVPRHPTPGYLSAHVASPVPPRPALSRLAALSANVDKQIACQLRAGLRAARLP